MKTVFNFLKDRHASAYIGCHFFQNFEDRTKVSSKVQSCISGEDSSRTGVLHDRWNGIHAYQLNS